MARCVLKEAVCWLEQDASLDVFVYLDTQAPATQREDACKRALRESPLWLDWVPGLTTAIVSDVSHVMPSRSAPIEAALSGLSVAMPAIVSRANLPTPAVSKLFEYDTSLFNELCDQLRDIDNSMIFLLQKTVLTYHHHDLADRDYGTVIINSFLEQRLATTIVHMPPAPGRDIRYFVVDELKKLAIHDASFHVAMAGFDDDKFVLKGWPLDQPFYATSHKQVVRATGMDLFWVKRSRTDPAAHVALVNLDPSKDIAQSREQVRQLCQRASIEVGGYQLTINRFEIKETTVTMMRNAANLAAEPYIREAVAALERLRRGLA